MKLYDLFPKTTNSALDLMNKETGSMPAGHNGSYHDPETPVRNTSHWLITFLKTYSISNDKRVLEASYKMVDYLCSDEIRPMNATFWHRKNPRKDTCNGLIGQAWTIEALLAAAHLLEMSELADLAQEVFLLHPFDTRVGLWQCVSADGTHLDFDPTFNHQLWFAAIGALLSRVSSKEVDLQVQRFMEQLEYNFETHSSGLIRHFVPLTLFPARRKLINSAEKLIKFRYVLKLPQELKYLGQKEVGYHSFNLYAFAHLKSIYPNHKFWKNKKFLKALDYVQSREYYRDIENSKYGYPYNPPGFETAYALDTFVQNTQMQQSRWVSAQIQNCYDFESNLMNRNASDAMTYAARMYEATRLSNLELELSDTN